MESAVENLIKYFMSVVAAAAVAWKGLDSWEKRKSSPVKEIESELKDLKEEVKELKDEQIGLKARGAETLSIVLSYFKK